VTEQSEDRFVKDILAIRDGLATIVEQLNDILKQYAPPVVKGEKYEEWFPEDLRALLVIEETHEAIIVKPKRYLGSENFAKVAAIVKDHNGKYVSAGKQSHFKIPVSKP
jgi:hypothetical protein